MTKQELLKAIDNCPMDALIVIKQGICLSHVKAVKQEDYRTLYEYGVEAELTKRLQTEIRLVIDEK